MNTICRVVALSVLCLAAVVSGCVCTGQPKVPPAAQAVAIEDVISQVQAALAVVQTNLAARQFPPMRQVKLSLQTVATKKDGLTLKLWVIGLGDSVETASTQQIDLVLVPPQPGLPKKTGVPSLAEDLENAILSAAEGVQKARSDPVPLVLGSLDVRIGFTVKGDVNGGPNVILTPITLGLSGDVANSSIQTITVSFATK